MRMNEYALFNLSDTLGLEVSSDALLTREVDWVVSLDSTKNVPSDEIIKYNPQRDDGISLILLFLFLVTSFIIGNHKKSIFQRMKLFFLNKERSSLFSEGESLHPGVIFYLFGQTTMLIALFFVDFFYDFQIDFVDRKNSLFIFGLYALVIGFYFIFKQVIYHFLGWIFIESKQHEIWISSYNTIVSFSGFILYPFLLFIIYFDLGFNFVLIIGFSLFFLFKALLLYKWINLFLINIYGVVRLFLYFCALEILPCLIIYKGLIQLNSHIIKL